MGLVQQVATMLCLKQAKSLGKDAFLQKYGETEPLAACRSQQQAAAQALVRSAVTACKQSVSTPAAMTACVKQKLMAALGNPTAASPTGGPAGGAPTQELVQKVAMALCLKEAKSLGKDAFLEKYGQTEPFAACRAQHQAAAQALVQAAVSACKESSTTPASFTACVMQRLQSVLGPPPSTTTHP